MKKIVCSDLAPCEIWKLSQNCNLNYTGSSPGIETAGATKISSKEKLLRCSSKEKHRLYYISFYQDGDSKTYPAVKDIYGPTKPIKEFECVGHYQKRVDSRLRNLKKNPERTRRKRKTH